MIYYSTWGYTWSFQQQLHLIQQALEMKQSIKRPLEIFSSSSNDLSYHETELIIFYYCVLNIPEIWVSQARPVLTNIAIRPYDKLIIKSNKADPALMLKTLHTL